MLHHRNYFATGPAFNGSHITNLPAIGDTINLPVVTDGNPITEALAQRHPSYSLSLLELYRLTYTGGRDFVLKYLVKRYDENEKAWDDRLKLTYCPAFAKDAIQESNGGGNDASRRAMAGHELTASAGSTWRWRSSTASST